MSCITLLSDFGLQDASVAIAKGILMQHIPQAGITDISHEVKPFHTAQAAYLLAAACKNFPAGTCHILLFDLFSEQTPRLLLSAYNGQYFLSPDNGLVSLAFGSSGIATWQYFEMNKEHTFIDWLHAAAQAAALLQAGKPDVAGLPEYRLRPMQQKAPHLAAPGMVACEVIHIDHYENVVINITRQEFESFGNGRPFRLQFMRVEDIGAISSSYADVREGYKLCRFNSNGYMEICINRGKAASLFGLRLGGKHNDIKIFFE